MLADTKQKPAQNLQTKLPQFPEFTSLAPQHQAELVELVKANHLYSDYNFISLWSWDHQNKLQLSVLNDSLVIRFQDYQDPDDYFFSFFGTTRVDETAKTLLAHSQTHGKAALRLIPQFVIEKLQHPQDFVITEDRDNFDYMVATKDMMELKSGDNEDKRWSMNQFMKRHGNRLLVKELDIKDEAQIQEMWSVVEHWNQQVKHNVSYNQSELGAIKKLFTEHHGLDTSQLHIVGLYLDSQLKAFSISEILQDGFAIGHYKKHDREYRGMGVTLEHHTARTLHEKGVSHLNHEQDLGIEGLRKAKLASHPVYFLKKYTLKLAN